METLSRNDNGMASIEAMLTSKLTEQLRTQQQGGSNAGAERSIDERNGVSSDIKTPTKSHSPSKTRSFSDSTPKLSPSPNIKSTLKGSKDDYTLGLAPKTPRRPELARGLSLQMPSKHEERPALNVISSTPGPLSPKLDSKSTYGSPALPRHSRGLDFARACTNLHHSTLAEQSSPDSSPTITQKGIPIPIKSSLSMNSMILDSPQAHGSSWSQMGQAERSMASGSVSSITMLDSSSSDSDDDDPMEPYENDDLMISTPQAYKLNDASAATPFASSMAAPKPSYWPNGSGTTPQSFMSFHRARMRHRRSRQSSSSASGHSSLASPIPQSPPNGRADGYFARDLALKKVASRRESLSLGTSDLHISSGNDSGDEAGQSGVSTPSVVQRPVTRRGNLLPKTRAFGRIRAELLDESRPVDTESKREAEVIRQVRDSDTDVTPATRNEDSSPLFPAAPDSLDTLPEDSSSDSAGQAKGLFGAFSRQAFQNSVNGGKDFWQKFDGQYRTPPPPIFPRHSSSGISDDINMDSPTATSSTTSTSLFQTTSGPQPQERHSSTSRSSTPQPSVPPPSAADGIRKRRRDDDLDSYSIKRRAVSPGMSVQNSPILSQSPSQRDASLWGQATPKAARENSINGHAAGERASSNGSTTSSTPIIGQPGKRVGLQGMTDTNDGLMKMSIE